MLNQNVKETELIRKAIEDTRSRLSAHMSYTIGGSGIAYLAINTISKSSEDPFTLSLICMFLTTLITAFLFISLYHFNSINRYTGYLKLLNIEREFKILDETVKTDEHNKRDNFISWEICFGKFANCRISSKFEANFFKDVLCYEGPSLEKLESKFKEYNIGDPKINRNSIWKGLTLMFKGLYRGIRINEQSDSWRYPFYSSYIYYLLILIFETLSIIYLSKGISSTNLPPLEYLYNAQFDLTLILFAVVNLIALKGASDIYKLMFGSQTVSAYCWIFLPFRIRILNVWNIYPVYYQTEEPNFKNNQQKKKLSQPNEIVASAESKLTENQLANSKINIEELMQGIKIILENNQINFQENNVGVVEFQESLLNKFKSILDQK